MILLFKKLSNAMTASSIALGYTQPRYTQEK